ncbi:MAG: butyrate kinase [Rhodothermaceae bacterium]
MSDKRVLAINPGSTSTKIAVYKNEKCEYLENIKHSAEDLADFNCISDQYEFRKNIILAKLQEAGVDIQQLDAIVGRGGLVKPIPSGVYEVNDAMIADLKIGILGEHASNLGGLIAQDLAKSLPSARAFIADPVVVDEMDDVARLSGHPELERVSIFHALNQKAIARMHSKKMNKKYEDLNLIVVHLGGGVSVGAHKNGRVVDVNQALNGDGPFSPERTGTLPAFALAKMCFSGKYTIDEIKKLITGKGGFVAYLGTNNAREVEERATAGDEKAALVQDAMGYQVAKEIGSMAAVLQGKVDAVLLTGGIAYNKGFVEKITERVSFIAPVEVYPGEDEMQALASNGLMVLNNEVKPAKYK